MRVVLDDGSSATYPLQNAKEYRERLLTRSFVVFMETLNIRPSLEVISESTIRKSYRNLPLYMGDKCKQYEMMAMYLPAEKRICFNKVGEDPQPIRPWGHKGKNFAKQYTHPLTLMATSDSGFGDVCSDPWPLSFYLGKKGL